MSVDYCIAELSGSWNAQSGAVVIGNGQRSVTLHTSSDSARKPVAKSIKTTSHDGYISTSELAVKAIDVEKAVEKLNKLARSQQRDVNFSVDRDAHATVIKVFKTETGELIKQFPSEEILSLRAEIRNNTGLVFDSKL
jgi:flagellar protein FlaG